MALESISVIKLRDLLLVASDPHAGYIEAACAAGAAPPVIDGRKSRLLLYVEDNPANLKLIEQLIARRPDMRLLTAQNGNDGIDLARVSLPDVILMDINLPGINGIEAMKILRLDPLTAHIPIVALSANAMPRDIEKGPEAGFFRYLTKPIKVNQFMDTLSEAMEFATAGRDSPHRTEIVMGVGSICQPSARTHSVPPGLAI